MPKRGPKKPPSPQGDPPDPQGMEAQVNRFLEGLRVMNYSPRTVESRAEKLSYFVRWCEQRGITRPAEVTAPLLEQYRRWLYYYRKENDQPLSLGTQLERLVGVRVFFKWLARSHQLLYNPASELELPRVEKRLPRAVLTAKEAETLLQQPDLTRPLGLRDRAILETFYSTGIRRLELIGLKLYDLERERGLVMIRQGKGGKDRRVPIGERALLWIERYLREGRPRLVREPDAGILFLTREGQGLSPARLSQLVGRYVRASELGKGGSCHLLRHTLATLMLEGGADIRFIQQMLGHAQLSTTEVYTQVSISKLKEVHNATHPANLPPRRPQEPESPPADPLHPHPSPLAADLAAEEPEAD